MKNNYYYIEVILTVDAVWEETGVDDETEVDWTENMLASCIIIIKMCVWVVVFFKFTKKKPHTYIRNKQFINNSKKMQSLKLIHWVTTQQRKIKWQKKILSLQVIWKWNVKNKINKSTSVLERCDHMCYYFVFVKQYYTLDYAIATHLKKLRLKD